MRPRNLFILVAVVLLVGGYILFFERHQPTTEETRQRADLVFSDLDQERVEVFEIVNSHGRFRFERREGDWQIVEPITFAADSAAVGSLLSSVFGLEAERRLAEVDLADYALDQPRLRLSMVTSDGAEHDLLVGDEAALGSKRAVSRGDGAVLMCQGFFVANLDKDLDQWRDRDVVDLLADQVASVEIAQGDDRVSIARSGDSWRLLEPVDDLADRDHVQALISDLNAMQVEDFADDSEPAADMSLDPARARITVIRNDDRPPLLLELGGVREVDGTTQVACRRNNADLLWVDNRAKTALGRAPVRWRAQKVYPFDGWNVEALSLRSGDTTIDLERAGGSWLSRDGAEADATALLDRINALAALEATTFDLLAPGGEGQAAAELRLSGAGGADDSLVSYVFHPPLAAGGDAIVLVSGRPAAVGVSASAVEAIVADLDGLLKNPEDDEESP